ncbi:MAG: DUF1127 domain-containing protein [Alphaproteobacteria bacterium]
MAEITLSERGECRVRDGTGLPDVVGRLMLLGRRWRKARRDRRVLVGMDGRTRRDIGVSAGDIQSAAQLPWWRWPLN